MSKPYEIWLWIVAVMAVGVPCAILCRPALHTDDEMREIADRFADKENGTQIQFDSSKGHWLNVVPIGEACDRGKVFKDLGIEERRIRDFRSNGIVNVIFLTWQVSPSYDLFCLSASNDLDNNGLELADPKRKVYGIKLVRR